MLNYYDLGQQIRAARRQQGKTQEQLAEMTGLAAAFISCIERGKKKASLDSFVRISRALGISLDWLLMTQGDNRFDTYGVEEVEKAEEVLKIALQMFKK